jgi:hypothetical protein
MNVVEELKSTEIPVELKYCERCGGLFLRPARTVGVHCASCRIHLTRIPTSADPLRQTRRRKARLPGIRKVDVRGLDLRGVDSYSQEFSSSSQIEDLQGVETTEVWG